MLEETYDPNENEPEECDEEKHEWADKWVNTGNNEYEPDYIYCTVCGKIEE